MKKALIFLLPCLTIFGEVTTSRQIFFQIEEKIQTLEGVFQELEKEQLPTMEAKNRFILLVEDKNQLLQQSMDLLLQEIFLKKLPSTGANYTKRLELIHQVAIAFYQMRIAPSWGNLQKIRDSLSLLEKELFICLDVPSCPEKKEKPKIKANRCLPSKQ